MNARARNLTPDISEPIAESNFVPVSRMSRSQLVVSWSVVGMMLVVVFLFGFYAGRKQGVELALTEQSVPRLRLPVESPKARAALSSVAVVAEPNQATTTKFDFTDSRPDSLNVAASGSTVSDTAGLAPKSPVNTDPSAGFVGKAANEISVEAIDQKKEIVKTIESVDQSLAERVGKVELSPALKVTSSDSLPAKKVIPAQVKLPLVRNSGLQASGLFVQVGAPDSFSKAQAMVSKLRSKGIMAAIRDASVNNKQHYRVLVGPFSSRDSAQDAKNQVIKSGVAMGEPFIKNY